MKCYMSYYLEDDTRKFKGLCKNILKINFVQDMNKRIKEIYCHGKGKYTSMDLKLMKINWNEEQDNRKEDANYQWHFIKEKIKLNMGKHVPK